MDRISPIFSSLSFWCHLPPIKVLLIHNELKSVILYSFQAHLNGIMFSFLKYDKKLKKIVCLKLLGPTLTFMKQPELPKLPEILRENGKGGKFELIL